MAFESIKQSIKRSGDFVMRFALALDAGPDEVLQAEIRQLRREVLDLQQQAAPTRQAQQSVA